MHPRVQGDFIYRMCGSVNYLLICGYLLEERVAVLFIVHLAAKMLQPVAHYQIIHPQHKVVTGNLRKHLGINLHRGGFVLDDDTRFQSLVIHHGVAAAVHPVQVYCHLVGGKGGRVALLCQQHIHKVLAHPLLGGEGHVATAQAVENLLLAIIFGYFGVVAW